MTKSLYAQYMAEREQAEMLEYDWGFAVYKFAPDHIYLQDIFVLPELRKSGKGVQLMNEVAAIGKAKGLHNMTGSVDKNTKFADSMEKIMLGLGFKPLTEDLDMKYLIKEI